MGWKSCANLCSSFESGRLVCVDWLRPCCEALELSVISLRPERWKLVFFFGYIDTPLAAADDMMTSVFSHCIPTIGDI